MKIISVISKFFIYGVFGGLTSVTLVLIEQSTYSKFGDDRIWGLILLVFISTLIMSGIVGAIIDRPYTKQPNKFVKEGIITGVLISIISFLAFGALYAYFETDGHKGRIGHALNSFYDLFIFSVWLFIPVGAIAGILAKIIEGNIFKNTH